MPEHLVDDIRRAYAVAWAECERLGRDAHIPRDHWRRQAARALQKEARAEMEHQRQLLLAVTGGERQTDMFPEVA